MYVQSVEGMNFRSERVSICKHLGNLKCLDNKKLQRLRAKMAKAKRKSLGECIYICKSSDGLVL